MSQFVNFKKRGFTLPPGCKDLMDLLMPPRKRDKEPFVAQVFPPLKIHKEHFPSAGLAQLERFVEMLLNSPGEAFVVSINAEGFKFPVTLYRSNAEWATAIVLVTCDVPQEEAIRDFFAARNLDPLGKSGHEGTASLVYPLPAKVPALTTLLTQLLQAVYALGEDAGLEFTYTEIEEAG